jgi:hypothetical protein
MVKRGGLVARLAFKPKKRVTIMSKVRVYRNLHKGCWSVQGTDGRVFMRAPIVAVKNARMVVRPAGRRKVLESGKKNVHAFIVGELTGVPDKPLAQITYRPQLNETFVRKDTGEAIHNADFVLLAADGRAYATVS